MQMERGRGRAHTATGVWNESTHHRNMEVILQPPKSMSGLERGVVGHGGGVFISLSTEDEDERSALRDI